MKKVGLICVTRSNSQKLLVTLNSIFRHTSPDLYDLFLIDNASHDDTLNIYSLALPENITIVRSNKNLNWVGGINLGIALTQDYEYVGFLNDDIDVGPNWLLNLVDLLDCNADLGAVGPLTSNTRDWQGYDRVRETFADLNLQPLDHISRNNVLEMYSAIQGNVPVIRVVGMLAFFCVLIRRKVVEKIGSLDPAFNELFLGDDDDYCRRMQAAGFGLALALRTYVLHASGSSSLNIADFERRQKMALDLLQKKQNTTP
jgi:GT2 family glycosyltransferase